MEGSPVLTCCRSTSARGFYQHVLATLFMETYFETYYSWRHTLLGHVGMGLATGKAWDIDWRASVET